MLLHNHILLDYRVGFHWHDVPSECSVNVKLGSNPLLQPYKLFGDLIVSEQNHDCIETQYHDCVLESIFSKEEIKKLLVTKLKNTIKLIKLVSEEVDFLPDELHALRILITQDGILLRECAEVKRDLDSS